MLEIHSSFGRQGIAVLLVEQISRVDAKDRHTRARDYLQSLVVSDPAESVSSERYQNDGRVTFHLRHSGILALPPILVEKLNRFTTKEAEGKRVVDIRLAKIQRVARSGYYCLVQPIAIAREISNHLRSHAESD